MLHSINYCMCVFLKFICIYFFLYYRGPCVRKLFTGLIMYLPSRNKEHCIVLYCMGNEQSHCTKHWLHCIKYIKNWYWSLIFVSISADYLRENFSQMSRKLTGQSLFLLLKELENKVKMVWFLLVFCLCLCLCFVLFPFTMRLSKL